MQVVERRKPAIFSYPDQVWGPKCNDFPGCTCDIMDKYSIRGYGRDGASVMLVGIAPGHQEEIDGAPLVGPSGKRNDLCLAVVKYPRQKVYATNLICWREDSPSSSQIAACWPRLKAEIETVQPRLILALGALACEWLTGYPIGKVRGAIIRPEYNRSVHLTELSVPLPAVLPTWHPAATLRIPSLATDVLRDYRKIRPFLRGRYEPLQWDWRLVSDRGEAQQVLDSLADHTVAIDVETEKDVNDAFGKIVCVAMATEDPRGLLAPNGDPSYFAYVFPVDVLRGLRWPKRVKWIMHNMGFDAPIIKREFGIWLTGVHDTFIDSLCRDERPGRDEEGSTDRSRSGEGKKPLGPGYHGLKVLAAEYLGAPPGYGDEMKRSFGKTLEEIAAPKEIPFTEEELHAQEAIDPRIDGSPLHIEEDTVGRKGLVVRSRTTSEESQSLEPTTEKASQGMEEKLGAQAQAVAVDLLAGDHRELVGRSGDRPATLGLDAGSEAAPTTSTKPTPKSKRKAKAPMRMETPAEAQDRFAAFLEKLYAYNALDAVNTVALPGRLPGKPCAARDTILMPAARAYARIHLTGVPVDVARAKELQEEWEPWIEELETALQEEAYTLGFRNQPTTKRDTIEKETYEEVNGEGFWPLGLSGDEKKRLRKEGTFEDRRLSWLEEHGPNSWPGYEPLNLGSSLQLSKFLYGLLRLPIKVRSKKTGKPSVGKEAIADIDHPFVDRMEEVRTAKHIKASHLDPIPELVKGDGRLHPNTWTIGASNYRRSITDPPMQQFPQEHPKPFWKRLAEVRSVLRPDPGFCFLEADYRQIELHGAARLSGDPVFLADLATGDYHTRIVREVFYCDAPEGSVVFTHTRRIGKVFNFAVLYRVKEDTLSKTMNEGAGFGPDAKPVMPREAGRLIRQWYARNRVYWLWQEEIIREVKRTGKIVNPFGEVRRFPLWDDSLEKQVVNFPVSSTCGAHSEISLVKLEPVIRRDFGGSILFDIHDSLLFHVPIKKRRSAARVVREVMEEPKIPGWDPLEIEIKYSDKTWQDMKVWDERK